MTTYHNIYIGDNRKVLTLLENESVDLVIMSPPYYDLKNYGNESDQIGFGQTYAEYLKSLERVFSLCYDKLKFGRKICVNVGDVFFTKNKDTIHKIFPVGADIIHILGELGCGYCGDIIWRKIGNGRAEGGSTGVMGSYPYPYNGAIKIEYEHIIVMYKPADSIVKKYS